MAKIALLIGVSEYEPGLNPLPAAVKDLDAMREVLLHPDIGGFAESDVVLLKNPERQAMEESIETLFANRHRDDLVFLFFSGHGIKDDTGRLYLAARKTRKTPRGDLVRSSAVSANFVHENMSRSRSKRQVVILDSCFSGAFAEGLSAKDDGTVDIRTQLGGEGRAVLTSSSSTQYSFEQEGEELSLYTRFLVEGIKTGEADQDGDDVVSIDELHEYASQKVREVKPELKPEIYAIREGFKIRLCKVPQGDPHERYKKEVARCGKRGELTIVSRSILDTWRLKLELSVDEAKALEDEVLEPYRREFQRKLRQYEQTVTDVLQRDGSINDNTRQELQRLQKVLELRNEDTVPIEARIITRLKAHKQNLETYKQSFSEALRQEYPLGEASRSRLQQMQQQLALSDTDVASLETQIKTEVETYRRNLQHYEQAFLTATQQEYPLSESKKAELRQQQSSLGLSEVEIAPIEAKVTTQIETYHQKLQQYEEAFASATQRKHQPGEANRTQLRQTWQTLGLNEADVKAIEAPISSQIETYQAHLRDYEQAFVDATEQEYPLGEDKRSELQQRQQALSLSDADIEPIENRITASIEDHLEKLQQYEQVFSDSIKFEFPVSEATREELRRFQQILELGDEEVTQLEEKVASQNERSKSQTQQADTSQIASQPTEVDEQEAQNSKALEAYEVEVAKWIQYGVSLQDSQIRKRLLSLQSTLGINATQAEAIEVKVSGGNQTPRASQSSNTASKPVQSSRLSTSEALRAYELEVAKYIDHKISLKDYVVRKKLNSLRNNLGISHSEAEAIEVRLSENNQTTKSPVNASPPPQVQPKYRRDSIVSKISQTNPERTSDDVIQTNPQKSPQQFLGSDNPPSDVRTVTRQSFWLKWTSFYAIGCGLGWPLAFWIDGNVPVFEVFIDGAIVGFVLGGAQWLLLRHVSVRMKLWIPITTVGYATGYGIGAKFFDMVFSDSAAPAILHSAGYGISIGAVLGLAQWSVLRLLFRESKAWILFVLIAETLGGAIGWGLLPFLPLMNGFDSLICGAINGAVSGLITGKVMLRLLRLRKSQSLVV